MKIATTLLTFWLLALSSFANAQDRSAVQAAFQTWLANDIWPRAQAAGISARTFDAALGNVVINWNLPDLIVNGRPLDSDQQQAEFRPPARYFRGGDLGYAVSTGAGLLAKHAGTLQQISRATGVPAQTIVAIWGRESSFGKAAIPHDAFEILSTKGFMSSRAPYFTDELIAALQIVEQGYAARDDLKSSWAGALGQPQFMPSNYLDYAVDFDANGHPDIWTSAQDTLASIGAYLQQHGWVAGRDWGFEVNVPNDIACALEGPDNGRAFNDWAAMGIARVSGRPFPEIERAQVGYLMMPAGRFGPAFLVTPNFYVLKKYNESDVYALFVGHVGDRMQYGGGDFRAGWQELDGFSRADITALQARLVQDGFDVGGVDGLIGFKTRRAIGLWQSRHNLAQTCYPTVQTVDMLVK